MKGLVNYEENNIVEFKEKFLNYIDVSEKTIETYKIALNQFIRYLNDNNIKQPTREDIIQYRDWLKSNFKPTTVNGYMISVKSLFNFLEEQNLYKNITKNVKSITLEKRHLKSGLSKEQVKKVLEHSKDIREKIIVKIMVSCALRANELVNIQLKDFEESSGIVMLKVLGKARDGLKQDSIKIDNRLYEEIKQYIKEYNITDYLVVSTSNNNTGRKITTKCLNDLLKKIYSRSGIDETKYSSHSLRHTSVDLALDSGLSLQEVSENVRHKNINTTMIYKKELDKRNSAFSENLCNVLY